jgi:hypothetical protein
VGSQLLGKPCKALDLALMEMRAGETRRVVRTSERERGGVHTNELG